MDLPQIKTKQNVNDKAFKKQNGIMKEGRKIVK